MSKYLSTNRLFLIEIVSVIFLYFLPVQVAAAPLNVAPVEDILEVVVNQQPADDTYIFLDFDGRLYIMQSDLEKLRIKLPKTSPLIYKNLPYYALHDIPEATYRVDFNTLQLYLTIPAIGFVSEAWTVYSPEIKENRPNQAGGFINYDTSVVQVPDATRASGFLEANYFGSHGVSENTFLVEKSMLSNSPDGNKSPGKIIRLNNTWTYDIPEKTRTLKLGDTIGTSSSWGRSVSYAGVQWRTNFSTQPSFMTSPLPSIHGEAVMQSTVDLYVNNALVDKRETPAGPFDISNIPVVNGEGMMSVVTTDLLGRQQVISVPYYGSASLLKPGLHDYSIEAGFIRQNYSLKSADYGRFMITGTDRYGMTDRLTTEKRLELLHNQQTLGLGGSYLVGLIGQINTAVAASHSTNGAGGLFLFGFQRTTTNWNFSTQIKATSPKFTQLGFTPEEVPPKLEGQVFLSFSFARYGVWGLNYTSQINRDKENQRFASLSYSQSIAGWSMMASLLKSIGDSAPPTFLITLNHAFDDKNSINMDMTHQKPTQRERVQFSHALPTETGWGYNVQLAHGGDATQQGELDYQGKYGNYSFLASHQQDQNSYQLNARGGVAFLGGHTYFSRMFNNSFGVVKVGDYPNIGVYANNQEVAHTDAYGTALIPSLTAYDKNKISIDVNELPMDSEIPVAEQEITPYYRSGIFVLFDIKQNHGAQMKLVLPDGHPVTEGASVKVIGSTDTTVFPVLADGYVYINGLDDKKTNQLEASWDYNKCQFAIDYPKGDELIPDLGVVMCKEKTNVEPTQ